MCRASLRFPHLSFIPPVPYPPLRGTFPLRGRLCIGDSSTLANGALETIFFALFHPARPLSGSLRSPPSPRGEGFVRRYSFFTYACIRSDNARKAAFSYRRSLPPWGRLCRGYCFSTHACIRSDDMGIALLSQTAYLRRSFPLFFIPLPHPTSASSEHLPLEGKALCLGQRHSHKCRACILCKQKTLCEDWLCRAFSVSIILRSRILRDFSAYPHHSLS